MWCICLSTFHALKNLKFEFEIKYKSNELANIKEISVVTKIGQNTLLFTKDQFNEEKDELGDLGLV